MDRGGTRGKAKSSLIDCNAKCILRWFVSGLTNLGAVDGKCFCKEGTNATRPAGDDDNTVSYVKEAGRGQLIIRKCHWSGCKCKKGQRS